MIRPCTHDDIPFLMAKAHEFNDRLHDRPLDDTKLVMCLLTLIEEDYGVALRSDHGAITGWLLEDPLRADLVLIETAWYSTGKDGMHLLKAFLQFGKSRNVNEVRMTTLASYPAAEELLHRVGGKKIETSWRLKP